MATFHENLVQSFTNFKNKYITPLNNNKANKTSVPASITRSGTSFSAKNSDGTEIFTFDQQDSNTWRGIQDNLNSTSTTESLSANQGYIMSRDIPWYGTSSTAASTIAKVATTSDSKFALTTGAKVSIKFTYDNTASAPTLNVDSTGAKSIKAYGTTAPTSWWQAGDVVTFTYDGTNWIMGATEGQISQIYSKFNWNQLTIPTPTVSDKTRTYAMNIGNGPVLVRILAHGYGVIDSRVVVPQDEYNVYANDGYTWSFFVKVSSDGIIVKTHNNSFQPDTYYLELNVVKVLNV